MLFTPLITAAGRSLDHARCNHSTFFEPDVYKTLAKFNFMAPRWHQRMIAPRALKKDKNRIFGKMSKSKSLFLGRFKGLGGMGVCGKHWKWSQLRACKIWWTSVRKTPVSRPYYFFDFFEKVLLGLSALRAPTVGP